MAIINQLQAASIPVYNAQVPSEGPFALTLSLDFSANASYSLDLEMLTAGGGNISMVQTIFLDTTGLTGNTTVTVGGTVQTIIAKANTQGYYPVLSPNPPRFTFANAGGAGIAKVILVNVPIAPGTWATA
jgi:hypothetical protein